MNIKILGIGIAGVDLAQYLLRKIKNADFIVVDTAEIKYKSKKCSEISKYSFGTTGSGKDAQRAISNFNKSKKLKKKLFAEFSKDDVVIIIAGIGGGTGSAITNLIIKNLKSRSIKNFSILITPLGKWFGSKHLIPLQKNNIEKYLPQIKKNSDLVIIIAGDKILEYAMEFMPDLFLEDAYTILNNPVLYLIRSIIKNNSKKITEISGHIHSNNKYENIIFIEKNENKKT